jgi:eukaryotic-like serine/threonine-protein kinase
MLYPERTPSGAVDDVRSSPPLAPGDRLGRFRIDRFLARGETGQVWLALDEGALGVVHHVALKLLSPSAPVLNRQLLAAARATSGLHHPNIVRVIGVVDDDERPQIVLEYVEGESLAELQRSLRFLRLKFPISVVADIGIAVAEALHYAWTARIHTGQRARVTHGDLSPSNILVANHGLVQLTDFGGAGAADATSVLRGTPAYRAPEVWAGAEPSPAADLFSLGVVLWELVTGVRFHDFATRQEAAEHLDERSVQEEEAAVAVRTPELARPIGALLARDPALRPASALAAAGALRQGRLELQRPADLVQFIRLVRAGRVDPEQRTESLESIPAVPDLDVDWMPLVHAAGFGSGDS